MLSTSMILHAHGAETSVLGVEFKASISALDNVTLVVIKASVFTTFSKTL